MIGLLAVIFVAGAGVGKVLFHLMDRKPERRASCGERCGEPYPVALLLSRLAMGYACAWAASDAYLAYIAGDYPGMVARALIYVLLGAGAVNDICCHECEYVIQYGTLIVGLAYAFFFCEDTGVLLGCAGVMAILTLIDFLFRKVRNVEGIGIADIIVMSGAAAIVDKPILVPAMVLLTCLFSVLCMPIALKNQKAQGMEEDGLGIGLLPCALLGVSVCNLLGRILIPLLAL